MDVDQLISMKKQMLSMGNWKEVERIDKIIKFQRDVLTRQVVKKRKLRR